MYEFAKYQRQFYGYQELQDGGLRIQPQHSIIFIFILYIPSSQNWYYQHKIDRINSECIMNKTLPWENWLKSCSSRRNWGVNNAWNTWFKTKFWTKQRVKNTVSQTIASHLRYRTVSKRKENLPRCSKNNIFLQLSPAFLQV